MDFLLILQMTVGCQRPLSSLGIPLWNPIGVCWPLQRSVFEASSSTYVLSNRFPNYLFPFGRRFRVPLSLSLLPHLIFYAVVQGKQSRQYFWEAFRTNAISIQLQVWYEFPQPRNRTLSRSANTIVGHSSPCQINSHDEAIILARKRGSIVFSRPSSSPLSPSVSVLLSRPASRWL